MSYLEKQNNRSAWTIPAHSVRSALCFMFAGTIAGFALGVQVVITVSKVDFSTYNLLSFMMLPLVFFLILLGMYLRQRDLRD